MLWGLCTIKTSVCSGRAGAGPGRNRVPGTEGGSIRWVPTGSWLRFLRFWSSGSWWVFDGVWRFRGFRVSMGSRRFRDQELQKTCGTKFLPSWGWHLCKKGLLNLLAVGDSTYAYWYVFIIGKDSWQMLTPLNTVCMASIDGFYKLRWLILLHSVNMSWSSCGSVVFM